MPGAGVVMLGAVALAAIVTGLPTWIVLIGVAMFSAGCGVVAGVVDVSLLSAMPPRILGLLESDLLQALPLYVFMGALLDRMPLATILYRSAARALRATGAGPALAGLGLGVLLAPMNGSVGASVAMLSRTVLPQLAADGVPVARSAALVCMASTLGIVIPPSLVLILLGDAMMRAHTEAVNTTHASVQILNTQDVFVGALVPAAILFTFVAAIAWWTGRQQRATRAKAAPQPPAVAPSEWLVAGATALCIFGLLAGVTLGYWFAVEAAAAGGTALFLYGVLTRSLPLPVLREALRNALAISGALFALLVAATVFTLVLRAFGTDRWVAEQLIGLGSAGGTLLAVLAILALCAFVLDAFEMIFVVVPVVLPPLLVVVQDATWVAVLALLILQASFLLPPFGYAVIMVKSGLRRAVASAAFAHALAPYIVAQWLVLALVLAFPQLVWHKATPERPAASSGSTDPQAGRDELERQLGEIAAEPPPEPAAKDRE
jgi:TRAP-type mannitol/chloroaromatic compound transport system permease large subunit